MHSAMLLVAALLEHALDYEHNVLLCCARLLMQFTQPRIIFKMEGGSGTVDEYTLRDFRYRFLLAYLLLVVFSCLLSP
jgi:hypothetical protein